MYPYPFNYFSSIFQFKKAFANRKLLSWFQLIFTSLFLISLTLIPMALQTASKDTYPLDTFIDQVFQPLDDASMKELSNHVQIKDGQLTYDGQAEIQKNKYGQVIIGQQKGAELGDQLTLYFDKEHLLISKSKKELAAIRYQAINQEALRDKKHLSAAISKDWFQQNRLIISLFLSGTLLTASMSVSLTTPPPRGVPGLPRLWMDKKFFAFSRLYLHKVIAVDREFKGIYILFL